MTLPNELHPGFFSAGGGADLGDTIDQSLRFKGSQYLSKSFSSTSSSYTFSFWTKLAALDSWLGYLFSAGGNNPSLLKGQVTQAGILYNQDAGGATGTISTNPRQFRDPSAWYHIVYQSDAGTHRIYVNGVLSSTPNSGSTNFDGTFCIGVNTNTSSAPFQGYMADWYAIDGQALAPTSFGKYNGDNVWVPQNYSGSYGSNGFHLTFDSSQANGIGHDSSGNGNHFTATGFDLTPNKDPGWESYATSWGTSYTNQPSAVFSGNADSNFHPWDWYFIQPSTANIGGIFTEYGVVQGDVLKFDVYPRLGTVYLDMNSGAVTNTTSGNALQTFSITVPSGGLSSLTIRGDDSTYWGIGAMYVNNVMLTNGSGFDYDLMLDSPTSNYATLNSLFSAADHTPRYFGITKDANLAADTSGNEADWATTSSIELPDGKWYFEVTYTSNLNVGLSGGDDRVNNRAIITAQNGNYSTINSFGSNSASNSGSQTSGTIGCRVDITNRTLAYTWDGTTYTSNLSYDDPGHRIFPYVNVGAQQPTNTTLKINHGQMPFIYTVPTGFEGALQTNNLPEPTIKNGKDHFGILTYQGNGSTLVVTDTDAVQFTPDLVWIKRRAANGGGASLRHHNLVDSVRGKSGDYYLNLESSTSNAENSDDHVSNIGEGTITVNDITSGVVNQNLNTFVAWCWKAGGTAVSNTNGTITSNVSANTDAGFSIVSYTGNNTNGATVGHGLNSPPEFILFKTRSVGDNWRVYHASVGATKAFQLDNSSGSNGTLAAFSDSFLSDTAPNSTTITLGNTSNVNGTGTQIAYCWHSVENYCKIGSYEGNNSTDGTFVYLGFKPSLIIFKNADAAGSWVMYDTARNTDNPVDTRLTANTNNDEGTSASMHVDFLSNGFKHRNNDQDLNTSHTFVYMAWAQHPFGGQNVPPATAR